MAKSVVIFGDGDFARIADVYLTKDSPYDVAAFVVNEAFLQRSELHGRPVVAFESIDRTHPPDQYAMFVAIGYSRVNKARAEVYESCRRRGYEMISYVCSKATQWGEFELGDNCFIFENNVVQPFVKIGNNVIMWSGNHIGHDTVIGDHCFIASHAVISGRVTVGAYSFIGVNATIRDGITIAPSCVIGAGALIVKDTQPEEVYKGPAAELSRVPSSRIKGL
ncbi:MAG TPA: acetyltransferase [Pirellulales bacterium]|nr:acetyltransferase [Pirellulales bacterium]